MDPSLRGALLFVRFLGVTLVGATLVMLGLQYADSLVHHEAMEIIPGLIRALPLVIGLLILFKSRALAQWLADWLEQ